MVIDTFRGRFSFLSNMHMFDPPIVYQGVKFWSSENLYQAIKTKDISERITIGMLLPAESKRFARELFIRPDWDEVKIDGMEWVLKQKFNTVQRPALCDMLDATEDFELIEGNLHGDTFWGVDKRTGLGDNHLGKLLMKRRELNRKILRG